MTELKTPLIISLRKTAVKHQYYQYLTVVKSIRNPVLYPTELWAQPALSLAGSWTQANAQRSFFVTHFLLWHCCQT